MFSNRRLGGMVGLGLGALYAWRNRSRFGSISDRFGSHRDDSSNVSGSQDISNSDIDLNKKSSGAV